MESNSSKPTSYKDLLHHFQQAESNQTPRNKKLVYRPLHLKQSATNKDNKQNISTKIHTQSLHEKSIQHKSEWLEEDVLKQYNEKRKDRQLQLTYHKFISYITNLLATLTGSVPPELLLQKITYLQYLAALKEMALIKENYEPTATDPATQLWNEMASRGQTIGLFILFVAAILNMRRSDDQKGNKYMHLAKKYADLRYTRMELLGKTKTAQEEQQFSFTPSISERSRTLTASHSKSKSKNQKCLAQKSFNQFIDGSHQVLRTSTSDLIESQTGNRRSEILYKMAKEKSLQKRRDKKSSQVEYQKSIKELTFHPKIHPNMLKEKPKKSIQGQQDSINRIIKGRVEREVRRIIKEKGLPYNQKLVQKMKQQRYQAIQKQRKNECPQRTHQLQQLESIEQLQQQSQISLHQEEKRDKLQPIVLTIQIDEDRCQKLVIEEPSRYKEAAAKFIIDFNLRPEMYDKLIEGVQKALKFQLTQVDQDSCQSQHQSIEE